jgi:hypothetical protein
MSKAQQIRELAKKVRKGPASISRALGCPEIYVLRVAWPATYRSVKAGQRGRKNGASA